MAIGAVALTRAEPARADAEIEGYLAGTVIVLAAADLGLGIYDVDVAARGEHPSAKLSKLEAEIGTPQAAIGTLALAGIVAFESNDDDHLVFLALFPTMLADGLTMHGFWTGATDRPRPAVQAFGSFSVGADTALSTVVLTRASMGQLSRRFMGMTEALVAVPQLVVSSGEAIRASGGDRTAWAALGVWSGALFAHGLASVVKGADGGELDQPQAPRAPVTLSIAPMMVAGATSRGPGVTFGGRF